MVVPITGAMAPGQQPFRLAGTTRKWMAEQPVKFGFNGLGETVYKRSYSRVVNGVKEQWPQTVARNVEGAMDMLVEHCMLNGISQEQDWFARISNSMAVRMQQMKFLPAGRMIYNMGMDIIRKRGEFTALNNCAFVSTLHSTFPDGVGVSHPFKFAMNSSMLGVGVGFDLFGAKDIQACDLREVTARPARTFVVQDTRESWVEVIGLVIDSLFQGCSKDTERIHKTYDVQDEAGVDPHKYQWEIDTHLVRKAGLPLAGFGGTSSGAENLRSLIDFVVKKHKDICERPGSGRYTNTVDILDLFNAIGVTVNAGGVRRNAEIGFSDCNDEDFMNAKDLTKFPDRASISWASNNSVMAHKGMDYRPIVARWVTHGSGEPGLMYLDHARRFGRMIDPENNADAKAYGANPCLEQTLEPMEFCCLIETLPHMHDSLEDFLETLEVAYVFAKIVTLGLPKDPGSAEVVARNRRIGVSLCGVQQFIAARGETEMIRYMDEGYNYLRLMDKVVSKLWGINESIKLTSIKPGGSVPMLAGATPGIHSPVSRFYMRTMRIDSHNPLVKDLMDKGHKVEDSIIHTETLPAGTTLQEAEAALAKKTQNTQLADIALKATTQQDGSVLYDLDTLQRNTKVVYFPVDCGEGVKSVNEMSVKEQLYWPVLAQMYWADNQVSCTVTFGPDTTADEIVEALQENEANLKGISFMPNKAVYKQLPYTPISKEEYEQEHARLLAVQNNDPALSKIVDAESPYGCDGGSCSPMLRDML